MIKQLDYFITKAIKLDPKYKECFCTIEVHLTLKKENMIKQLEILAEQSELDPKDKDAFVNRAESYDQKGEYDKAIEDFIKVIKLDSESKEAFLIRAMSCR